MDGVKFLIRNVNRYRLAFDSDVAMTEEHEHGTLIHRDELIEFKNRHGGTPEAVDAATLMSRIPWHVDELRRDQIDKDGWRALWVGRHIYDEGMSPRIEVVRGFVLRDGSNPDAVYQVDGLSGATLTGNGVTKLVQHWMGPEGFGPYLETFR